MSNINYECDKSQAQGLSVTLREEEFETTVYNSGIISIYAINGKIFLQARNLGKVEVIRILTEVIGKIV